MKIAILGTGGAGTTAAWLLDGRHEVDIYERNASVGGHAHTVEVEAGGITHYVDDGFNWFSTVMYPRYLALLEANAIETIQVPMSASYWDMRTDRSLSMPPLGMGRIGRLLLEPSRILTLLRLNSAINYAEDIVASRETQVSGHDFLARVDPNRSFSEEFLTPFMSGTWGCPHERVLDLSIYPLMKYIVLHKPQGFSYYLWQVVKGGCNSYIRRIHAGLQAQAKCNAPVKALHRKENGIELIDSDGNAHLYDHVITTCGARDTTALLANSTGFDKRRAIVEGMEYYQAHVATHTDAGYMPPARHDWAVCNVRYCGKRADATIWDGWRSGQDVFDSYIDIEGPQPKGCVNVSNFWLPLEDPKFFRQQAKLASLQGDGGLWVCGDYTQDIGGHEDAVASAHDAVEAIEGAGADNGRAIILREAYERHLSGGGAKSLAAE